LKSKRNVPSQSRSFLHRAGMSRFHKLHVLENHLLTQLSLFKGETTARTFAMKEQKEHKV
jgi:hypothetical protein